MALEDLPGELQSYLSWPSSSGAGAGGMMDMRRRIALQMLANKKSPFPKNKGEGMTYLGESIGDALTQLGMMQAEKRYQENAAKQFTGAVPGVTPATPPVVAAPPVATPAISASPARSSPRSEAPAVAPPAVAAAPPAAAPDQQTEAPWKTYPAQPWTGKGEPLLTAPREAPPPAPAPSAMNWQEPGAGMPWSDPSSPAMPEGAMSFADTGPTDSGGPPQAFAGRFDASSSPPPMQPETRNMYFDPKLSSDMVAPSPSPEDLSPTPIINDGGVSEPPPPQQANVPMPPERPQSVNLANAPADQGGFNFIDAAADQPKAGTQGYTPDKFANVRYNNPGAQYPGPTATQFGSTGTDTIGGGHKIADFPTPVHGAAANFATLDNSKNYVGHTISDAINTWSGGGRGVVPGYDGNTVITKDMVRDPNFAIPFMQAVAGGEAPGKYPMSDEQWKMAHNWFLQGGPEGGGGTAVASRGGGGGGVDVAASDVTKQDPRDVVAQAMLEQAIQAKDQPPSQGEVASQQRLADVAGSSPQRSYISFPQTASRGDIASDAKPLGAISPMGGSTDQGISDAAQQRRDAIAGALMQGPTAPAQEVPQPNPIQTEAAPPVDLPSTQSSSMSPTSTSVAGAEDAVEPPNVVADIKPMPTRVSPGAQLAQAGTPSPDRPLENIPILSPPPTGLVKPPQPPATFSGVPMPPDYTKQVVKPQPPGPPVITPEEQKGWELQRQYGNDPYWGPQAKALIEFGQNRSKLDYDQRMKDYEKQLDTYYENVKAGQARGTPEGQAKQATAEAELQSKQDELALRQKFGGRDPKDVFTELGYDKTNAVQDNNLLNKAAIAKTALDNGIISGFGADRRLNVERLKAWMTNNKSAGSLAYNTQIFQSAMNDMLSVALDNLRGEPTKGGSVRINPETVKIAQEALGADPNIQKEAALKIIEENTRNARERINTYENKVDQYVGGTNSELMYRVPTNPTVPPEKQNGPAILQRLLDNRTDPNYIVNFDKRFGPGAAELEIARAQRREARSR